VHDLRGRLVWCSPQVRQDAGAQAFRWDGRGDDGRAVAAGIYLYAIELDGAPAGTGKLSLIK
jgi:flagellar hook assembly protein FlgD